MSSQRREARLVPTPTHSLTAHTPSAGLAVRSGRSWALASAAQYEAMRGRAAAGEPCGRAAHGGGAGGMDLRRTSAARCGRYVAAMLALLACAFSAGSSWGRRAAIAPQLSRKEGLGRQAGPATDLAGGMLSTAQGGVFSPKPAATRDAVEDGRAEARAEDAATATSRALLPPQARADAPIGSTLVGGLAPSSSARLEGAACASSPKQSDALHIAYAFEASGCVSLSHCNELPRLCTCPLAGDVALQTSNPRVAC